MSRPPNQYNEAHNRFIASQDSGTIDFRVGNSYACDPMEYNTASQSVYAQAGFPGYNPQSMAALNAGYGSANAPMTAYPQQAMASAYSQQVANCAYSQPQGYAPQSISAPASMSGYPQQCYSTIPHQSISTPVCLPVPVYSTASLETEAVVQERIKANIDAIIETQKTAMLNSKLESLTDKVQSLAHNIESNDSSNIRSLSDRVERLSRNIADSGEGVQHMKSLSDRVERLSRNIADSGEGVQHIKSLSDRVERLSRNIADSGEGVQHIKSLSDRVERLSRNISESGDSVQHIKSLSDRVEQLSRNISNSGDSSSIKCLADKFERLSRNIELSQQRPTSVPTESLSSVSTPIATSASDSDIARRLRRLAAESSARQTRSEERIPDW
jgi:methyl-accepting chemotaxis protein